MKRDQTIRAPLPVALLSPGAVLEIWSSTSLTTWTSAGFIAIATGNAVFTNEAVPPGRRFYRAQQHL